MTNENLLGAGALRLGRAFAGGLFVLGVAAAAFDVLQSDTRHAGGGTEPHHGRAASVSAFIVGEASDRTDLLQTSASAAKETETLTATMHKWGLRHIVVCEPGDGPRPSTNAGRAHTTVLPCAGSLEAIAADARAIAAARAQAVLYSGTADDAAAFITALRAEHSFAMVVLASSVDRARVSKLLPGDARRWVLAARRGVSDGPGDAPTLSVAMLGNRDRDAR